VTFLKGDVGAAESYHELNEINLARPAQAITVLYTNDNIFNAQLMEGIISIFELDPNLLIAKTGAEGIERAQIHKPDVLLLDVELSDMDGLTVLDQLAEST